MRTSSPRMQKIKAHGIRWLRENRNKKIVVDSSRMPVSWREYFRGEYRYNPGVGDALEYAFRGVRPIPLESDAQHVALRGMGIEKCKSRSKIDRRSKKMTLEEASKNKYGERWTWVFFRGFLQYNLQFKRMWGIESIYDLAWEEDKIGCGVQEEFPVRKLVSLPPQVSESIKKAFRLFMSCDVSDFPKKKDEYESGEYGTVGLMRREIIDNGEVAEVVNIHPDMEKYGWYKKFVDAGFLVKSNADIEKENAEKRKELAGKNAKRKKGEEKKMKDRESYGGKWFFVTFEGYAAAAEGTIVAHSVMKESEWTAFSKCLKKHGKEEVCGGILYDECITFKDYLDSCSKVEVSDSKTREFLIKHCEDNVEWSPREIWDECKRHFAD